MRLTAIRELLDRPPPYVTVHVEVGRPTEDARQQVDARWTTIRHQLEHQDVDDALLEEIGRRLRELPPVPGEARRTLVAAADEVVFDEVLGGEVAWPESAEVSLLPDLGGWLKQADRQHPFVLAMIDREGADIGFHPGLAAPEHDEDTVQGEDYYITKVAEGDWAQKQFQQTAENRWAHNAADVAEHVRSGLRDHPAVVVVLAGDDHARHLVEKSLEGISVPIVHVSAGGRAEGASQAALWENVRRVLADVEAHDDADAADRLQAASGQGQSAAHGIDRVMEAFVQGRVERLVIDLDAAREKTIDPADHPGLSLPEGVAGPLPADRVLVASAALTDAAVSVLPAAETGSGDGVAALLRWS